MMTSKCDPIEKKYPKKSSDEGIRGPKNLPNVGSSVWVRGVWADAPCRACQARLDRVLAEVVLSELAIRYISIHPNTIFTAYIKNINKYICILKDEDWDFKEKSNSFEKDKKVEYSAEEMCKARDERIKVQNEMIKRQKKEIEEFKEMMIMERKCMQYEVDDGELEINELKMDQKEMVGKLVKMKWLVDEIQKIGGFRDSADEIVDLFEDIEIPDIPLYEKEEFVPTENTNTVDSSSLEEDREFYGPDFYEQIDQDQVEVTEADDGQENSPTETTVDGILQGNLVPRRLFFEEDVESQSILVNPQNRPSTV